MKDGKPYEVKQDIVAYCQILTGNKNDSPRGFGLGV